LFTFLTADPSPKIQFQLTIDPAFAIDLSVNVMAFFSQVMLAIVKSAVGLGQTMIFPLVSEKHPLEEVNR